MADRTVTVKSSGGDYTSLNAAFAGEDDTYADLVTNTMILTFDCYNFEDTTAANTGTAWTTSASYYLNIIAHDSHGGKWSTSAYRLVVSGSICLDFQENYGQIIGIQMQLTAAASLTCLRCYNQGSGASIIVNKCIAKGVITSTNSCIGFFANDSDLTIEFRNCLAYDFVNSTYVHSGFRCYAATNYYAYNCTAQNCYHGFSRDPGGTFTAKNCGAASCTTGFNGTITQTTCSTSAPTFADAGNDDFHLASNDTTWLNQGTDLSGTFTDDIDGQTRPTGAGTWDIGADEYVAAGTTMPIFLYHYMHH